MRTSALLASVCTFFLFVYSASAQQYDAAIGLGTLMSTSSKSASVTAPASEKGGTYPAFSADVIFKHHIGIAGEASWRSHQAIYPGNIVSGSAGQHYRPFLFDVNALYQPRLGDRANLDLMAGVGWQRLSFAPAVCVYGVGTCTSFSDSNQFLAHIGGGVRYYIRGNLFVRPEFHYYRFNNNPDFYSPNLFRVGVSVGYSIHRN